MQVDGINIEKSDGFQVNVVKLDCGNTAPHFPGDLIERYTLGSSIFEVGFGAGFDAIRLSSQGYDYTGIDISSYAISTAKLEMERAGITPIQIFEANFYEMESTQRYDAVFERGVFHNQKDAAKRQLFAEQVRRFLFKGGCWISISGAAEVSVRPQEHGCLSITEILEPLTGLFIVEHIERRPYGPIDWPDNFEGWYCVFKSL